MSQDFSEEPQARNLYYVIPSEVMEAKDLNPLDKLLYGILSGYAHRDGKCWPSDDHLAERLEVSKEHVNRMIRKLTEKGYISKITQPHPKNKFKKQRIITVHTQFKKSLRNDPQINSGHNSQINSPIDPQINIVSKEDSNRKASTKVDAKSTRKARATHVSVSDEEHERLVQEFGEETTQKAYERLSEWKITTARHKWKKDDNRSIRRWVLRALEEDKKKSGNPSLIKETQEWIKSNIDPRLVHQGHIVVGYNYLEFPKLIQGLGKDAHIKFDEPSAKERIQNGLKRIQRSL